MSQAQNIELTEQVPNHVPESLPEPVAQEAPAAPTADSEPVTLADDPQLVAHVAEMPHPRALGSPLQMGASRRQPLGGANSPNTTGNRLTPPPPGRSLSAPAAPAPADEEPSSLQRAISAVRSIFPFVQRLLPLLDGNLATAITNLVAGAAHAQAPAPKIDLAPIEDRVSELRIQHRGLRDQIVEQNAALLEQTSVIKRVEDQLEMVREATDRNTLEQQEMLEDLKAFGSKVRFIAVLTLILVLLGLALNVIVFLRFKSVFP